MSEFCNFEGLITLTENVQKNFIAIFVISRGSTSFWKAFIKFHWNGQKITKVMNELASIRLRLNTSILRKIITGFYTYSLAERDTLLEYISDNTMETDHR